MLSTANTIVIVRFKFDDILFCAGRRKILIQDWSSHYCSAAHKDFKGFKRVWFCRTRVLWNLRKGPFRGGIGLSKLASPDFCTIIVYQWPAWGFLAIHSTLTVLSSGIISGCTIPEYKVRGGRKAGLKAFRNPLVIRISWSGGECFSLKVCTKVRSNEGADAWTSTHAERDFDHIDFHYEWNLAAVNGENEVKCCRLLMRPIMYWAYPELFR